MCYLYLDVTRKLNIKYEGFLDQNKLQKIVSWIEIVSYRETYDINVSLRFSWSFSGKS